MSRLYAFLGGVLVVGGVVALAFGAWVLGAVLLLVGGGGLVGEVRERRKPGYIPMFGRNSGSDNVDKIHAEVLAVEQIRGAQSWMMGGPTS